MAGLWEADSVRVSALADSPYPQFDTGAVKSSIVAVIINTTSAQRDLYQERL
jgi:hypothetical protein